MSERPSPRPESFDDLPDYVRRQTVLSLNLTADVFGTGLLLATDTFVTSLKATFGERIVVHVKSGELEVDLLATDEQLAKALAQRQEWWDRDHPTAAPSAVDGA